MRRYALHLQLKEEADPRQRGKRATKYCRGWFIGEKEDRKALVKDLREKHPDVVRDESDLKAPNEAMWDKLVDDLLA